MVHKQEWLEIFFEHECGNKRAGVFDKERSRPLSLLSKKSTKKGTAFAKNKLDKIGAGDSFFAIISLCKSCNLNEINSIFLASLAAAYTVEKFGNDKPINLNETKKILSHILI